MKQIDNVYFQTSLREFLRKKSHNYIVFSVTFEELGILEHRTVAEMILILNGFLAKVELKHIDLSVFLCFYYKGIRLYEKSLLC